MEQQIQALALIQGTLMGVLRAKEIITPEEIASIDGLMTPLLATLGPTASATWIAVLNQCERLIGDPPVEDV